MQYTPPPHVTQHWLLSKPSAKGRRGMVVSQAKGAAEAGVAVLDAGGNAIDAAVATALALATHEPWNSGLGGIGFALVHRAGQKRAEVVDFGPRAPAATNPATLQTDRAHDHRPVRLAGGRGRHQHPWPAVGCHSRLGRGLRVHAPAMGQAAAGGRDRAGHRAGEARSAAGLVHRAEGRHLRVGDPALSAYGRGLSAERPAAGATLSGQARLLPPGQPAGHAGAPRPRRPARLLRGRDRRLGRRRCQGAGRRAVARGPAQLPGAHLAGGAGRLARPHAAAHRWPDRRADAEARAGGHGGRALWRSRAVARLVPHARPGDEGAPMPNASPAWASRNRWRRKAAPRI